MGPRSRPLEPLQQHAVEFTTGRFIPRCSGHASFLAELVQQRLDLAVIETDVTFDQRDRYRHQLPATTGHPRSPTCVWSPTTGRCLPGVVCDSPKATIFRSRVLR